MFEGRGAKKDWCGMSAGTVGERKVTARNDVWYAFHYNINEIQAFGAGCARSEKAEDDSESKEENGEHDGRKRKSKPEGQVIRKRVED